MSLAIHDDPTAAPTASSSPSPRPVGRWSWRVLRSWSVRVGLTLVVVVPGALAGSTAMAARSVRPSAPAKPPTITQLQAKIEKLQENAEKAAERYNGVQTQIQSIQVRVKAAKDRGQKQQVQVDAAREALGTIAAERYRAGDLAALSLLFSNDPDALLAQSGLLATLGDREATAVQRMVDAQRALDADNADLQAQSARLQKAQAEANTARRDANTKVAAAKAELNRLSRAQLTQIMAASRGNVRENLRCDDILIVAPDAKVQKVIDYACDMVRRRVPYVWGGTSSGGVDCSGLTLLAWKQAGVNLPRVASAQYADGTHLSTSKIRPGDLVFRNSLGHVGIYIGNGLMIHAPHTGDHVRIAQISSGMIAARY